MFYLSVMIQEMSRSATGKSGMATDAYAGSETAARLADYSGTQYYFLSGRSIVTSELPAQSGPGMLDVASLSLPAADSADSGSEKDATSSKDHKTDHPGKDPAKVCVALYLNVIID